MKPRVLPSFIRLTLFSAVFVTQAPGQQRNRRHTLVTSSLIWALSMVRLAASPLRSVD